MSAIYLPEPEPALITNRIILWRDVMRAELDYPTSSLGPLFICRQSIGQHSSFLPLVYVRPNVNYNKTQPKIHYNKYPKT